MKPASVVAMYSSRNPIQIDCLGSVCGLLSSNPGTWNSWHVFCNLVFKYVTLHVKLYYLKKSLDFSNVMVLSRHLLKMAILYGKPGGGQVLLSPRA